MRKPFERPRRFLNASFEFWGVWRFGAIPRSERKVFNQKTKVTEVPSKQKKITGYFGIGSYWESVGCRNAKPVSY